MFVSRLCFLCPPSSLAYEGAYCIFWNCFSLAKAAGTPRFSAKLTDVLCSPSRPHLTTIVGVSSPCHHLLTHQSCLFVFVHHFLTVTKLLSAQNVSVSDISAAVSSVAANFSPSHDKHFRRGYEGFLRQRGISDLTPIEKAPPNTLEPRYSIEGLSRVSS